MNINEKSTVPKYKQIVHAVMADIEKGVLKKGDGLLSINEFSEEHYLSRDTVEKAYKDLREHGMIISVRGKGYFVNTNDTHEKLRIFLHFNKLSTYKKTIYDAFVKAIGNYGTVDIFIHHNNLELFENQLLSNIGTYSNYVIIPPDTEEKERLTKLLKKVSNRKLLLLDKWIDGFQNCASVVQNFEKDIFSALSAGLQLVQKYRKLTLVFPKTKGYAHDVMVGFTRFCSQFEFEFDIVSEIQENKVNEGKAFIVIDEEDLVQLLKFIKVKNLKVAKDIGIISYNDTPLKEILWDGITVITTNFEKMGETAANLIMSKQMQSIENPFKLIVRESL